MLHKLFKKENKAKQIAAVFGFAILSLLVLNIVVYFLWFSSRPFLNEIGRTKEIVTENLMIETDKLEYQENEIVKITFTNLNGSKFNEGDRSAAPTVNASRYMGKNYGVGMIERFDNGQWLAIEPVWRCDNECFRECGAIREIKADEVRTFYWPQTIVVCNGLDKEEELMRVEAGRYRVSSAIYSSVAKEYKTIYSGEFVIK